MNSYKFAVDGMHCHSCELSIERRLKKLPGVVGVDVNAAKGRARLKYEGDQPSISSIDAAVSEDGYRARALDAPELPTSVPKRPGFLQLVGLFGLVWLIASFASSRGLLNVNLAQGSTAGFWAAFTVGLVAATSSCLAVAGGLLLSSAAAFNRRHPSATAFARMQPVFMFVGGRVLTYTLLGGLLGAIGAAVRPSASVTGAVTLLAAFYMLTVGLDMLGLAPSLLKSLMPRLPRAIANRAIDAQGNEHPVMPFLLGGATFFMPCGFTQALQIYALTTGSFVASALTLAAFSLGTVPALLALGWASNGLKGKAGSFFFRFSGALVVMMGLWNVQNGLTSFGYPLSMPKFPGAAASAAAYVPDPNVAVEDGVQVIRMKLASNPSYLPSDTYTVKAGMPVRMEIEGPGTGCRGILQVPKAHASVALTQAQNVLEFTPKQGDYVFSCSMGMFPGMLKSI